MKAHDVKHLVAYYVKKYDTRNPFRLAEYLNVEVQTGPLGSRAGCYMFLKNHKCIFLNEDLENMKELLSWLTNLLIRLCTERKIVISLETRLFC